MSGQIAFSRTLRSLDSDRFRGSWVGLLFSALLLAAWLWWMFTPRVPEFSPLSESVSLTWNLDAQQVSVAGLPPDAFQRIHLGQAARLSWEDRTIIAQVSLLPPSTGRVVLDLTSTPASPLPAQARVEIEVKRVSPAAVTLRLLQR